MLVQQNSIKGLHGAKQSVVESLQPVALPIPDSKSEPDYRTWHVSVDSPASANGMEFQPLEDIEKPLNVSGSTESEIVTVVDEPEADAPKEVNEVAMGDPAGTDAKSPAQTGGTEQAPPKPAEMGDSKTPEDPDEEEMESLYENPRSIEGYAGWKNNMIPKSALDNDVLPIPDRWRLGMPANTMRTRGNLWNPYRQNMLKGDYPIIGQSIFLSTLAVSDTLVEGHSVPTPSQVSSRRPGSFDFFGRPDQLVTNQNFIISLELFKGETDFKPREWEVRVTPVFNLNYANTEENFAVNIDPRRGDDRLDYQLAFQELFGEYHFRDLSPNYDFVSSRTGIQFYNNDFRGFLFADNNLGGRIFGNYESNRLQYNLAYFEMLNKDTNSGLNSTFEFKDEHVLLANLVRQDTFWKGYSFIFNMGYSNEETSRQYNQNGVIVRPAPIGSLHAHSNKVGYIGFGGDGHIGRLNLTHQFYQAYGHDTENPLAGRSQTINAQMFALEASVDVDWMRFRASYFYASGDDDVNDKTAKGFDSIFDDPNFAGGQFSYWVRQGFGAGNALTSLKSRFSLIPNLATSKGEGQANFVNPGVRLINFGYDAELTPRLKAVLNFNYLEFADTKSLEVLLQQNSISRKLGYDYSMGMIYRPMLNNQVIITGGVAGLTPKEGFRDIYGSETLYSGFLGVTVKY